MPIEIKEMHIKINVSEEQALSSIGPAEAKENMIQECMDQMTKILNDKEER